MATQFNSSSNAALRQSNALVLSPGPVKSNPEPHLEGSNCLDATRNGVLDMMSLANDLLGQYPLNFIQKLGFFASTPTLEPRVKKPPPPTIAHSRPPIAAVPPMYRGGDFTAVMPVDGPQRDTGLSHQTNNGRRLTLTPTSSS